MEMGLEAHMYASQWFLTLFTAKFPLFMVYHILDLVLSEVRTTQLYSFMTFKSTLFIKISTVPLFVLFLGITLHIFSGACST